MRMKCMYCLITRETGEREEDHEMRFITGNGDAALVYKGESLCVPHWNVVRGWPKDYGKEREEERVAQDYPPWL